MTCHYLLAKIMKITKSSLNKNTVMLILLAQSEAYSNMCKTIQILNEKEYRRKSDRKGMNKFHDALKESYGPKSSGKTTLLSVLHIDKDVFLHTSFIKIEKFRYFSGGRQIYLTLLAWLLIQDKKSTRLNSIVSSPKLLLPAILFNKTRLHWCEFIGYILDSHSFSTKNKSKLHLFSI